MSPLAQDPADLIWLDLAHQLGWTLRRGHQPSATWDGAGTLTIPLQLHDGDTLAQQLLQQICRALVQGPRRQRRPDWGLGPRDEKRLEAALRLQAELTGRYGLRQVLRPPGDGAPWAQLPPDPLTPATARAVPLAIDALLRATQSAPWATLLPQALQATAALAAQRQDGPWADSLPPHPTGLHPAGDGRRCGDCAWGQGPRCLQADTDVQPQWPACLRWEPPLSPADCEDCGACCRQGFDLVPVAPEEPLAASPLVVRDEHGLHLPRPQGFCVALEQTAAPYRCLHYDMRPANCRELEPGGTHCLQARRRVGLSA